ncbi:hypothetical protein BJ944DRAFT_267019 [Cunninghamella echinulata]|nr:hypothetical protein BJ944DRAFT_267019 [Cunninghamella echinulata]
MATQLPLEIQHAILTHLSPKDSSLILTTCKNWLPPLKKNIYTNVIIYSTKQCERFIECLKENKKSTATKNIEDTNGYLVKEIILNTDSILLSSEETRELQELTPMVTRFDYADGTHLTDEHLYYFLPVWKHLTTLPVYHEDIGEDWIPILSQQLIHLACHGNELDCILKKKEIPNDHCYITQPIFPKLKTLELNLQYIFCPFELSTLEWVHQVCPLLTSLSLILQSTKVVKDIDNIEMQVVPNPALSEFKLNGALLLVGTGCFDYFIRKYQHLKSLDIVDYYSIDVDTEDEDDNGGDENNGNINSRQLAEQNSKTGLFRWITENRELTSLQIDTENENSAVPWDDLQQWIKQYRVSSNQLENVSTWTMPMSLNEEKDDDNNYKVQYVYYLQLP